MEIILGGKKGGMSFVSKEDFEELNKYHWYKSIEGYVCGTINKKIISMHRFITKANNKQIVDHINGNTLDNRKENLRITTTQKNNENKGISKSKISSKYKNVYYVKQVKKYRVEIKHDKESHYLGYYDNEMEAAEMVDMYIVHKNLNHIRLNFPEKKEQYLTKEYKPKIKQSKSEYMGVRKLKNNRFMSGIIINGKHICIHRSINELECANKYDEYIVKNNIPHKKLNFLKNYPNYNPRSVIKTQCKNIDENVIQLLIKSNQCVTVDKEYYDKIKYNTCYVDTYGYVKIQIGDKNEYKFLHRFLMEINDPDILIDHIDSNKLNNCKKNLRISDHIKNAQNKSKMKNTTSKYIGVCYHKTKHTWNALIRKNGNRLLDESFATEDFAARKRDLFIMSKLKNDHYKLNFVWTEKEIEYWTNEIKNNISNPKKI